MMTMVTPSAIPRSKAGTIPGLQLGEDDVGLGRYRVVDLLDVVLDRVVRVADALVVPAGHFAEVLGADLQSRIPITQRLRHPDELALGAGG
jgi:hypothetical protein